MNEILGILIPMLMSGADISDILRAIGGAGSGAVGMDGLKEMLSTQQMNARMAYPLVQNQKTINRSAESLIDRLGINPYSGFGQGLSTLVGSMYHIAPDTIGAVLGVPNRGQFFSTVANGSSGINKAAGFGTTDIFNPHSILSAHRRTMDMAKTVYDLGTRPGGGYNINYGHGLNMDEMGKVTQRLLSSGIPYREYAEENGKIDFGRETGNQLNPENAKDAEKFKKNLEKLGSKFNEAASMLSKVTGSVEEALNVMDRLAGGNFLGGTAEQATAVANRARKMATAIRVTSAVAGLNPQEMYANMSSLQQSMSAGLGLSPYIAKSSGFNNLMQDMAYTGTLSYSAWAAMNPTATSEQRQQALFAANGRSQAYANSNGAALAAAVADNAKLFSQEELDRFKKSFQEGRPNEMVSLIRQRIGSGMFTEYMTDPSMQMAARKRAAEENPTLLREIDQAGQEGNLAQAETFGANRLLKKTISDMDTEMSSVVGKGGFAKGIDEKVTASLRKMAVQQGLTEEAAGKMKMSELQTFLKGRPGAKPGDLEKVENVARIEAARTRIGELTMNASDESAARDRLRQEIAGNTNLSDEKRAELMRKVDDKKTNINDVYKDYSGFARGEAAKGLRTRVFGGKMTQEEADRATAKLDRLEKAQRTDFTSLERMDAIENSVKRSTLEKMGSLKGAIFTDDVKNAGNEGSALAAFTKKVQDLNQQGIVSLDRKEQINGKEKTVRDSDLSKTYGETARRIVSGIFGSKLGTLEGKDLTDLTAEVSQKMLSGMKDGKSVDQAFVSAIGDPKELEKKIGADGVKTLQKFVDQANDPNSLLRDKTLNRESFFSVATSVLDENTKSKKSASLQEMRKLASGNFGKLSEKEAVGRFAELSKELGLSSGNEEEIKKIVEGEGTGKDKIGGILKKIQPTGQRVLGFEATTAAGNANQAALVMAAAMARMTGLDLKQLNLGPGSEEFLSSLDKANADATMNRIPNALKIGDASYYMEAVKNTEGQIGNLRKALHEGKIDEKTVRAAFGTGKDAQEAKNALTSALKSGGRVNIESDLSLIETLTNKTIGGKSGMDVLFKEEAMAEAKKQKGADADIVDVTKEANRKESGSYDVLKSIGDLTRTIAPFIQDPSSIFKAPIPVRIADDQIPLNAE